MEPGGVAYAYNGDVSLAYRAVGDGPLDLVLVTGWVLPIELFWDEPGLARFLDRLASGGRLIVWDKRGTGLSDRLGGGDPPTLEDRMGDLRAVMDLPLGDPRPRQPWAVMVNILGGDHGPLSENLYAGYPHVLARDPRLKVHLYGKGVKPGRKVGHVTAYGDDLEDVRARARHAAAWFRGDLGQESE